MKPNNSKNPAKDVVYVILIFISFYILLQQSMITGLLYEINVPYHEHILPRLEKLYYSDYKTVARITFILASLILVIFDEFSTKRFMIRRLEKKKNLLQTPLIFSVSATLILLLKANTYTGFALLILSMIIVFITRDFAFNLAIRYPKYKNSILKIFQAHLLSETKTNDGFDSLEKRERLLNNKIIGEDNEEIKLKFHHNFKRNIELLCNGNPRRGNLIVGGSGAGKSYSILNPMVIQTIKDLKVPMVLYDFKFPNSDNQTKIALKAYLEMKKLDPNQKMNFHLTTFSRQFLHNISRINPICADTIISDFHADSYMKTFFSAMDKKWIKDPDFWAKSVFAYTGAVALAHKKYMKNFSLAHIIHFLSQDYEKQVRSLVNINDSQINAKIENVRKPIIENRGGDQLSGIFSTLQNFLTNMHNPEFFYAISKEEASLHVNNPENPIFLSIGNDNQFAPVFSPLISMYCAIIFASCNREKQLPLHFMADEAPTLFLPGIDQFINTGRGNDMITTLGIQGFAQNNYVYGQEMAKVLQGSLANLFCGQLNDDGAQTSMSKMMGNYKMQNVNNSRQIGSVNSKGGFTESENKSSENYIRYDEIANLDKGYFFGKVAEGNNTKFMGAVDVSEHEKLMNTANRLPYPLGPGIKNMVDQGDIERDDITRYYQGDKNAEVKINNAVYSFAESEYQRIQQEANIFLNEHLS